MSINNEEVKKILVLGLDNSGKTSIILNAFKKDLNLLSYFSLKPTSGIDITNMEDESRNMTIWDFGGQEQYRAKHLETLSSQMEGANELIYVLDIQDEKRYDQAIQYFKNIMEIIKNENITLEIKLYFHEFDPTIEKTHPKITKEFLKNLSKRFRKVVPIF